ncbi:MAG: sulfatase-like hydrolase/transferase [Planctomycetota bacterium]|nr:sulfatase-like hydrolase/transferase [Planctomycetota bacterium]
MRIRFFSAVLLAVPLVFLSPDPARAAGVDRPNILLVMVDDLGKDWISCYGADDIETPHIDRLAATGMRFDNAWSMPQCTPTRATLLTGQYPWRTGWVNHWDVPRWGVGYFDWQHYTTFATVMKSAGYATAIAGKWQINDFRLEPRALEKHGFDDWCVWTGYEGQNPPSGKRYWDAYIHTREGSKTYEGQFGPDVYCDFLIDFMKKHQDEPQMLYFPMALTHGPLVHTPSEPDAKDKVAKLKAMVRYTDRLLGRLVKALEELGIRQRTVVIFTTDNGTSGGMRGTVRGKRPSGGKASKYEGGVCEPFIVSCPGLVPEGAVTDALTDFTDLLPTFAELGGAKLPEGLTLDGTSFAPLILGKAQDSPREWIMALGHGGARLDAQGVRGVHDYTDRVIRDKRFKVWVDTDRSIVELYDLKDDPLEQRNLIGSDRPELAAVLKKFQAVVDSTPRKDARPTYRKRPAQPWARKFTGEEIGKKDKAARKKRRRDRKKRNERKRADR